MPSPASVSPSDSGYTLTRCCPPSLSVSFLQQRLLVISFLVLHAAQQLTGINAIFYYSNSFFVGVIDNPLVGTTLVGVINVVSTYVALQLMDKAGRYNAVKNRTAYC